MSKSNEQAKPSRTDAARAEMWAAIRQHWELDPDAPSYSTAAARVCEKLGVTPPQRPAVCKRASVEKWARRGSMNGVVAAAHLRADKHAASACGNGALAKKAPASAGAVDALESHFFAGVEARAAVLERHRAEWDEARALLAEALELRGDSVDEAFHRAKLAKISAETVSLTQAGERRAWGLDTPDLGDIQGMSDARLESLARCWALR